MLNLLRFLIVSGAIGPLLIAVTAFAIGKTNVAGVYAAAGLSFIYGVFLGWLLRNEELSNG